MSGDPGARETLAARDSGSVEHPSSLRRAEQLNLDRRRVLKGATGIASGAVLGSMTDLLSPVPASASGPNLGDARTVLRTPEACFGHLPDYPFEPHYTRVRLGEGSSGHIRMHYVDVRPTGPEHASGEVIVLLHGNPSWSYLYRRVIPPLVAAGHRCIAVDLVGFGRSDKLTDRFAYTYRAHVEWLRQAMFDNLGLRDVTLVCHDWGGTLGLLLVAQNPSRFRRIVASNTGLRAGGGDLGPGWEHLAKWLQFTQRTEHLQPGNVVEEFTARPPSEDVVAAYNAPYPNDDHLHGVRRFAVLIPITEDDEANPTIEEAWAGLDRLDIPFLCLFSAQDHVTGGRHAALSGRIPGAQGQPHTVLEGAAHFLQEDKPTEFAGTITDFIALTS